MANDLPIDDLKSVDIFDSDDAKIYLTKEKEATYSPPIISFFEKLVSVVKKIGNELDNEKSFLIKKLPVLDQRYMDTTIGKFMAQFLLNIMKHNLLI